PSSQSSQAFGFPGATPSISANGTAGAILWAAENSDPAVLHAYDARDLANELYNSSQAANGRDQFGEGNKFITPTIANGRVYVGTTSGVGVFGLLGVPGSPANFQAAAAGSSVTLGWNAPAAGAAPAAYVIEVGTSPGLSDVGVFPVGNTTAIAATGVTAGSFYLRIRGQNAAGVGPASNEVLLPVGVPGPPSGLTASAVGSFVTASWNAPTTGEAVTSYVIEAGSAPGLSDLGSFGTGTPATTASASDVPAGSYFIRVRAQNAAGTGAPSNEILLVVGAATSAARSKE
ncbi:MAG TPA: fibronectin type III domain-containing protein, partial [Candidatus Methylomirabilis sp.]|nr:fibronectin type III domain-containing protein [Candidatus Methylomirabilis sp.]